MSTDSITKRVGILCTFSSRIFDFIPVGELRKLRLLCTIQCLVIYEVLISIYSYAISKEEFAVPTDIR